MSQAVTSAGAADANHHGKHNKGAFNRDLSLQEFETAELDPADFTHEQHIRMAWMLLQEAELLEAIARYRKALKRITRKFGAEAKYHETITWFYLVTIAERMVTTTATNRKDSWSTFRTANRDLFEGSPSWLGRNYSGERLASERARQQFVLPDRLPFEG